MRPDEWRPQWRACAPFRYQLAEGARWIDDRLLFVDLLEGALYRCRGLPGADPERLLQLDMPLGAAAPVAGTDGEWIVAAGAGIALTGPDGLTWLSRPGDRRNRSMRMNDGACDPSGRFWAGSMEVQAATGAGSLYRTDPDGSVHEVLDNLSVPNGPAFSADGRLMYLADSARRAITRHTVDPVTGELGRPQLFAHFAQDEGRPDGLTVDDNGNLWVALWGAGRVLCYQPDGRPLHTVHVPTPHASSVAFGGGFMFVTTALHRLERPGPLAGAVLAGSTGVTAPPARLFGPRRPA
ncbi:SMP-30/gluconolactonase/LRE family protein [Streptomyces sp. NPDC051907]|uniref:SMP-30/gluconolactonase/LRE family protein n=1 Tax=Streptomyces sp. NPDC051907 TaxID=3155284 RepID=UPI00343CF91F